MSNLRTRGVEVLGVTGFSGFIPASSIEAFQSDSRVLLVDPWEDLTAKQLKQKYSEQGYVVDVRPTQDPNQRSISLDMEK